MLADVELGELSRIDAPGDAEGDAQSEFSLEDQVLNFSLDLAALRSLARTDALLKNLKNIYANYDNNFEKLVSTALAYNWFVLEDNKAAAYTAIRNEFNTPSVDDPAYPSFIGFSFYVRSNVNQDAYTVLGQGSGELLKVVPPGPITYCNSLSGLCADTPAFSNESPFVVNWPVTQPGSSTITATEVEGLGNFNYTVSDDSGVFGSFSSIYGGVSDAGYWDIYMNPSRSGSIGSQHFLGRFDMSLAEPFARTAEGISDQSKPIVFLPAIRLETSTDGIVSRIDLRLHQLIDGSFQQVDLATTRNMISSPSFFFNVAGCNVDAADLNTKLAAGESSIDLTAFSSSLGFPGTEAGDCEITKIGVSYNLAGIDFQWQW